MMARSALTALLIAVYTAAEVALASFKTCTSDECFLRSLAMSSASFNDPGHFPANPFSTPTTTAEVFSPVII